MKAALRNKIYKKLLSAIFKRESFLYKSEFENISKVEHSAMKRNLPELYEFSYGEIKRDELYTLQCIALIICIEQTK